jgi:hypothetical protein
MIFGIVREQQQNSKFVTHEILKVRKIDKIDKWKRKIVFREGKKTVIESR